jgi:hypothetical protein
VFNDLTTDGVTGLIYTFTHSPGFIFSTAAQIYRLKAKNAVGWSASFSPNLTVTTDKVPPSMTTIAAGTVTPTTIAFSWPELTDMTNNGGDIPYYYQVEWLNTVSVWTVLTTSAIGKQLSYTHEPGFVYTSGSSQ